jgi:voltage-gated potassium channel
MAQWRRWFRLAATCAAIIALYFLVPATPRLAQHDVLARTLASVAALGLVAWLVTRQLRLHIDHDDRRVDGLVASVVTMVMVFSLCFYLLEQQQPSQLEDLHTRVDALYFTMSTLVTIGYGDVHAVGQTARILVMVQMLFDVVFIAAASSLLSSRVRAVAARHAQARRSDGSPRPPGDSAPGG